MKPADLQALLEAHDAEGCIALFARATEAQRRALAKTAVARLRAATADVPAELTSMLSTTSDEQFAQFWPSVVQNRGALRSAQIAVLATATIAELKRFGQRCFPSIDDALAVLAARRPPWVGEWAEVILSWDGPRHSWSGMAEQWRFVRRLVREGLCDRRRGSSYIHGMIIGLTSSRQNVTLREALLEDKALLDDEVWELFETEPMPGLLHLLPTDETFPPAHRWECALAALAAEGLLSRARLLDASIGGLECDYHEFRARWFAFMHETLRPTLDERAERAGRYVGLAASRNPSTVTFSLKALAVLDDANRLEPGPLLEAIGPALLARAKGTVQAALALIASAARRDPALRQRAATVAVDALAHESPAVHEAVVDLIVRHGEPAEPALADLFAGRASRPSPPRNADWPPFFVARRRGCAPEALASMPPDNGLRRPGRAGRGPRPPARGAGRCRCRG